MPEEPRSLKLYRLLLRLYPPGFRDNFGQLLEREFRDEWRESTGASARALLWLRLLADLARTAPLQFAREVAQDARHTLRLWAGRPWHTGFAIAALAIGVGANVGVFSVVNALLLRSLPFHDPGRLAAMRGFWFVPHGSAAEFHNWSKQSAYLDGAALSEQFDFNLGGAGESRRAHVAQTSSNFFSLLGARPVLGRAFAAGEDVPGHDAVAVIGYGLWQQWFGGARAALGSTIRVGGKPLIVIGVAPPGFDYPGKSVLWKAATFDNGNNGWDTIGRLKPGVSWPRARAAFAAEAARLSPDRNKPRRLWQPAEMVPLQDELAGPVKKASLLLLACVALILCIACTNVANLWMARTADRASELSIRSALGASRARLSRQLLTECVLLSLAATAAGFVVAFWTTSVASQVEPAPLASQAYSILDGRVLAFAIAMSLVTGLLFGVLPAWCAGRIHTFGNRGAQDSRASRRLREVLVGAQVMLTIVLVSASISVGRAFVNLMHIDRGFSAKGLITVSVALDGTTQDQVGRQLPYFQEALARVRRLPGVLSASATEFLPLYATSFIGAPWKLDGRPAGASSMIVPILPDYFRTMGTPILHGREFTAAELRTDAGVAVVNEQFAREFGPAADAVGRRIDDGDGSRRIVGVVRDTDYMTEGANSTQVFVPSRSPGGFFSTFVVRVDGQAADHLASVRDTIRSVDPKVPVFGVKTMEQRMDDVLARPKFYRTAVLSFAAFAFLLAVIGIYGIVSYAVAQRAREMGLRMALGSTPLRLRAILVRQGLLTVAVAAIPGVAGAILTGRYLENLVDGAKSGSAATCAATVLLIACTAAAGIWVATRPIARLDVMEILRTE